MQQTSTALISSQDTSILGIPAEDMERWKRHYAPDAPKEDWEKFIEKCVAYRVDPRKGQCHLVGRNDKNAGRKVYTFQMSFEGLLALAQKTGEFEGFTEVEYCDHKGKWSDVWLVTPQIGKPETYPYACRVGIMRRGFAQPLIVKRYFHEVAYSYGKLISNFWEKMPLHMFEKCTMTKGVRIAFVEVAGSIYIPEEMHAADAQATSIVSIPDEPTRNPEPQETNTAVEVAPVQSEPTPINTIPTGSQLQKQVNDMQWSWDVVINRAFAKVPNANIPAILALGSELNPTQCKRVDGYIKYALSQEKQAS